MNLLLDVNHISVKNFYYLDTKRNVIIDGNFTKMIYSTEYFSLNGAYFEFPIEISQLEKYGNKTTIRFNPVSKINTSIIHSFSKLESAIIDAYKTNTDSTSKSVSNLSKQMNSGIMKIYREFSYQDTRETDAMPRDKSPIKCILKMSGIWESSNEIGITFKLFRT
jgi:hypothetical protein